MSRSIGDLVAASVGVTWEPGKLLKFVLIAKRSWNTHLKGRTSS